MSANTPSNPSPSTEWTSCGARHVAVYGTLRAGGINDITRLDPDIVCTGTTGLMGTLYDLGWYPGLQLQGTQAVLAEVYPIDDALEQAMDRIEGIWPEDVGEYVKRVQTMSVTLPDGRLQNMDVLVYEALPPTVNGKPVLAVHDWLAWLHAKGRVHPGGQFALNTQTS